MRRNLSTETASKVLWEAHEAQLRASGLENPAHAGSADSGDTSAATAGTEDARHIAGISPYPARHVGGRWLERLHRAVYPDGVASGERNVVRAALDRRPRPAKPDNANPASAGYPGDADTGERVALNADTASRVAENAHTGLGLADYPDAPVDVGIPQQARVPGILVSRGPLPPTRRSSSRFAHLRTSLVVIRLDCPNANDNCA